MRQPDAHDSDPASRPSATPPKLSRCAIPVSECYIVFTIWGFLFALLLPAVNVARRRQGRPPVLPWVYEVFGRPGDDDLSTSFFVTSCLLFPLLMTLGLLVARSLLPEQVRAFIPLRPYPSLPRAKPQKAHFSTKWGLGVASITLALAGSALLVFAATHVRSDRTNRRPVVTYVGPAADWVTHLAVAGWLFSLFALIALGLSIERKGRLDALSWAGVCLAVLNVFASCMFWAIMNED